MTTLYIDADACPVKEEALHVAERHGLPVFIVSNSWLRMQVGDNVRKIVVSEGADAADDWIAEHIQPHDIAVTADIPLASRCIKKGALALGMTGRPFTPDNIGTALALRELGSHLRETGESKGYNPSFTKKDRSHFLRGLEDVIQKCKREAR